MHRLFPSQLDNETIYLVVREHWVRLALKLLVWLVLAFVLFTLKVYGASFAPGLFEGSNLNVTTLFMQVYTMLLLLSLFIICLLYYLNIQVITNLRVVDIDQIGLFAHTVAELHIDKIEDVTSQTEGILGTMFNYGEVFVQTAGTKERFVFENVPNPGGIEKLMLDLYEKNSNFAKEGKETSGSNL